MRHKAIVIGGTNGLGASVSMELLSRGYECVHIVGRCNRFPSLISAQELDLFGERIKFHAFDLLSDDYSFFDKFRDVDTLIITAGFGRVAPFESLQENEVINLIKCNAIASIRIIQHFYKKIHANDPFYSVILGSIAGHIVSPLFSVYGAAKSCVCSFVESINAELSAQGCANRILDVSPGKLEGTSFYGGESNLAALSKLSAEIIDRMLQRETLYIPQYDDVYKNVLDRYQIEPTAFAEESYQHKMRSGRVDLKPQITVGYLSGTFDLFHVGHLNLLRRAKEHCDYLIVGVHKSGAWKGKETFIPFEERLAIVQSVRYVDQAIESFSEDSDAYDALHYDLLFVGSDYRGSERFARYEEFFADKNVKIIYFPYTQSTSSTQMRKVISQAVQKNE